MIIFEEPMEHPLNVPYQCLTPEMQGRYYLVYKNLLVTKDFSYKSQSATLPSETFIPVERRLQTSAYSTRTPYFSLFMISRSDIPPENIGWTLGHRKNTSRVVRFNYYINGYN